MARKSDSIDFEKSLQQLETIVQKLEAGDLSLEASLEAFEKGITLTKECQKALKLAEQKVSKLVKKEQGLALEPFEQESDSD